ncbi:sec-independent protein translocase protein TATC, chloroplastic isoform 2 [Zea mays]|uniref:Sec-independent protein translocase protein TATC, chloroplastic n=1 Tax=Zea mays TaxID=4577 RepID=C4IYQ1_MAIZE|nr:sec-independent protein translocase protein TATC, chloroplastic isoform 2 [Zea mays]ACR34051.1 unknown [Zea mays]ONL95343.1 Sec-independent protein translocase protein TATC, chloroplastic [Zea mays]|eukprot:NP_001288439.1 sec-independent protein translocase protein TATC, chloroplastic isoform 2 [Zea mays]
MGSAGALLWHTPQQLHGRGILFRQSRPLLRQRNLPLISLAAPALEPERRRRQCLRCAAVDGDGALRESGPLPQKESPSSGIGAALEDPPPGPPVENGSFGGPSQEEQSALYTFLYPSKDLLPDDKEMSIFDHLEELRDRIFISVLAVGAAILGCFAFSKDLVIFLEAPVTAQGVRFLQLSPGEFFFTTLKVSGYCGLLLGSPIILYEIIAFVIPDGAVESLWSIDQYFEFILVLMFSTGLSFQVPVIQLLLGQLGLVSSDQMLSIWRYVVVGAVVAAAVLTPSTDPLTQMLLAGPLLGLYLGGAWMVKITGR